MMFRASIFFALLLACSAFPADSSIPLTVMGEATSVNTTGESASASERSREEIILVQQEGDYIYVTDFISGSNSESDIDASGSGSGASGWGSGSDASGSTLSQKKTPIVAGQSKDGARIKRDAAGVEGSATDAANATTTDATTLAAAAVTDATTVASAAATEATTLINAAATDASAVVNATATEASTVANATSTLAASAVNATASATNATATCAALAPCYDDGDCNSGKCIGGFLHTCDCNKCINFLMCSSDKDCGGLNQACSNGFCDCFGAYVKNNYTDVIDAWTNLCNVKSCQKATMAADCHGLSCNQGFCVC